MLRMLKQKTTNENDVEGIPSKYISFPQNVKVVDVENHNKEKTFKEVL